jgi:predicted GIY-YIG superfamily endonuclease
MNGFSCVYILESKGHPGRFYVGLTDDLASRLAAHNGGSDTHTAKFRPWHIKIAVALRDRKRRRV